MTCGASRPRFGCCARPRDRLFVALAVLGPGLIAANAGNDAGGIATYSSVGARYGYDLLWMMVVITVSLDRRPGDGGAHGCGHRQGPRRSDSRGVRDPLGAASRPPACSSRTSASASRSSSASALRSGSRASRRTCLGADRRRRGVAAARPRHLQVGGADLRGHDDPVLRLPDRRDPRASELGRTSGTPIVVPQVQTSAPLPHAVRRDRRDDDHAVHAALPPVGGRRARPRAGRA